KVIIELKPDKADQEPVPTVTSLTGRVWMDRNLGASQVAASLTDEDAYGGLYQWGRLTDGHEKRTSLTTTILSSTDVPGHDNFILAPNYDWRISHNDNLWQGVNGINNPCPNGFRLPTTSEFEAERASWSSDTPEGAFSSPLKLPFAGWRVWYKDVIARSGTEGAYWTSTGSSIYGMTFHFYDGYMAIHSAYRAGGISVRCIQALPEE
ncbi:MAG: hypothetical protein D3923_18035, partial [Candidatus Electrothrix sp. AR3]|nr:hypothetical protein [Candidatus Electrothrix sp. AR3]